MNARIKHKTMKGRKVNLFASSIVAISMLQGSDVYAQSENERTNVLKEEIVVVGIRRSLEQNLDFKRYSDSVADLISAEEIGKFPDKNIADALQRVPGVTINRDGGEGSRVSIRGLGAGLTYTQLNGNYIASAAGEPTRSFLYTLLPSNMVSTVEVLKSPQAKYDEGGVGGSIILKTRKPLDSAANSGFLNVEGTWADVTDKFEPNYSGSYSWKNENETFGILVAYTNQDRTNRTIGASTENWNYVADQEEFNALIASGQLLDSTQRRDPLVDNRGNGQAFSGFWAPNAVVGIVEEQDREREGFQFSTQWKLSDKLEFGFDYMRFDLGGNFDRFRLVLPEWNYGNGIADGGIVLDEDSGTLVSLSTVAPLQDNGEVNRLQSPQYAGDRVVRNSESDTFTFNARYGGESWTASAVVGNTEANGGDSEQFFSALYSTNEFSGSPDVVNAVGDWTWDLRGEGVTISSTDDLGGLAGQPNALSLDNFTSSFTDSTDEETYAQLDLSFDVDWGMVNSIEAGVKYRNHEINRRIRTFFFDDANDPATCSRFTPSNPESNCPGWLGGGGNFVTDVSLHPDGSTIASRIINQQPIGNIVGDALNVQPFSAFAWDSYRAWLFERFGNPIVDTQDFNVYSVEEDITAAYVQASFSGERLRGNIGVRAVQTDQSTDVFNSTQAPGVPGDQRVIREGSASDVLPSFNLAYDINEDFVLRAAANKVLSRVPYGNLGGAETLIFTPASNDGATPEEWRGSGGNPDLEPFEATAFDVALEWYYAPGSALSFNLYQKNVKNFIVPATIAVQREIDGQTVTVDPFTTTVNGSDVDQKGFEVAFQNAFSNGFGVIANYTYNDSEQTEINIEGQSQGTTSVPGVADDQFNLVGYYENEIYSVRLAYNRVGERPGGVNRGLEVVQEEYDQIDLNATYNFSEDMSLSFAAINLTENIDRTYLGEPNRLAGAVYPGRRFYFGLNYKF